MRRMDRWSSYWDTSLPRAVAVDDAEREVERRRHVATVDAVDNYTVGVGTNDSVLAAAAGVVGEH